MTKGASLLGRARELEVLRGLVDGVRDQGRALLLRGDPGIGKSALAAAAAERAAGRGMTVLTTTGVLSEAHLPFAGLHRLIRPVRDLAEGLPEPQRAALAAISGRGGGGPDGEPPDPHLVALAALDLLCDAAQGAPVLVVADDVQWLDGATVDVLVFVARRVASDPVVLLLAERSGDGAAGGAAGGVAGSGEGPLDRPELEVLPVVGLDEAASAALLAEHAPDLPDDLRRHVLALAAGNPLALVELPKAPTLGRSGSRGEWPALTARLEQAFAGRASTLDAGTQDLLLVAALDDGDDVAECLAAATALAGTPVGETQLATATAADLVARDGDRLHFRHPLVRSALRQAAGPARRQAAHGALAQTLADTPDRALWHRAAAATAPDEALAAELEAAAGRAQRFRAARVAVDAYRHAARLSETPRRRGGRLLTAAECALDMGDQELVADLLAQAHQVDLGPVERARLAWLEQLLHESPWRGATRTAAAVELIDRMRLVGDVDLALRSLFTVAGTAWWDASDPEVRALVLAAADRFPMPAHDPRLMAIRALAAPVESGATVLPQLAKLHPDRVRDVEALHLLGLTASVLGAIDEAAVALADSIAGLRSLGRLQLLAQAQTSRAICDTVRDDWAAGLAAADEAARLGGEVGRPSLVAMAQAVASVLTARRGDADGAVALAADAESFALPVAAHPTLALALLGRATAALGAGRYGDAFADLRRLFDPTEPAHHPFVTHLAVVDLAEAGAGSDSHAEARRLLGPLEEQATRTPSPLLHTSLRVARPLLATAEGDGRPGIGAAAPVPTAGSANRPGAEATSSTAGSAEELFRVALTDPPGWAFMRARLLLAHGAWLRRQRRVAESRHPLRTARDFFDALGARQWSERARQELRAAGETSSERSPAAVDELTSQELQVARLVAAGLTNREIGERLYLSPRTVGAHLYRIFPKLGVTTRTQLAAALGPAPG